MAYFFLFLFKGQEVYSLYITFAPGEKFACYSNSGSQKTMKQCLQNSERKLLSRIIHPAKLSIKSDSRRDIFRHVKISKTMCFDAPFLRKRKPEETAVQQAKAYQSP